MSEIDEKQSPWDINKFAGIDIRMRKADGFLSATDMIRTRTNLKINNYLRNEKTNEYIKALEKKLSNGNTPNSVSVIDIKKGGLPQNQGSWFHPKLAVHFAMWISPEFSVEVIDWVDRFIRGDISLVKDIVNRHDKVHNTTSEVLITTLNNQLGEYKTNIKTLEDTNKNLEKVTTKLHTQIDKLNEYRCTYCHRRYSSTSGLTRHLKNCADKNMREFRAVIEFDKFLSYFELLNDYVVDNIDIQLIDWDSDEPMLLIKKYGKKYKFNVFLNESRWKVIKFLENDIDFPLDLMLSDNSIAMFRENEKYYTYIHRSLINDIDATLGVEFKAVLDLGNNSDDEESEEDEESEDGD